MPAGIPTGASCVQRFDDSRNYAIHITFRNSLRSSSLREPRDPLLKVVFINITLAKSKRLLAGIVTIPKSVLTIHGVDYLKSVMILPQVPP